MGLRGWSASPEKLDLLWWILFNSPFKTTTLMDAGILKTRNKRAFISCPEHPVQRVKRMDGVLELIVSFATQSVRICIPLDDDSPCTYSSSDAPDAIIMIEPELTDSLGELFSRPRNAGATAVPERISFSLSDKSDVVYDIALFDDSPLPTKRL